VFNTADGIAVRPVEEEPAGRVRVRVSSVSICGSDLWLIDHGPSPFVVGHEFAGHLDDGTLVAVYPLGRCGSCPQCAAGNPNRCPDVFRTTLGLGAHGGMRDEAWVDPRALVPLPEGLDPAAAALVEPVAVGVHALDRAGLADGRRILVMGAGPLGLTVAALARYAGHDVTIVARHPFQRAAADRLGLGLSPTGEYDVVFDAAGSVSALAHAAESLAPGGTLVLLGMYPPDGVHYPAQTLMAKEATAISATAYRVTDTHDDFRTAAHHLRDHPELAATLITHRYPLDDAATAFATARDRDRHAVKVVVHPG
jgi:2-desacetyl-2-hydroxyethyl bacteriochlorophyllide A dehydrogenase